MQNGQEIRRRAKKMGAREDDDDDDDDVGYPGFDCRSRRKTTAPANPTRGGKYTLTPGPTEDNGARRMASRPICNDPSAGSPTETLLRLLLPLNDQV